MRFYSLIGLIKCLLKFKMKFGFGKGELEVYTIYNGMRVKALSTIYQKGKKFKQKVTPCKYRLKPGDYNIKVEYMSEVAEKDVEIKDNEKTVIEFRFPTGILECHVYEGTKEVKALVEILNNEGKLIAKRQTPFIIHLESGYYNLRATYTPEKK